MSLQIPDENLPVLGEDQQVIERSLDVAAAINGLDLIGDTLRPHYDLIRSQLFGHSALYGVASREQRLAQAEADMELLTGFGSLLPPALITNGAPEDIHEADAGRYGERHNLQVVTPDLYTAKLVQSFGLFCEKDTDSKLAIGYIVGERALRHGSTHLLLATPPIKTYYPNRGGTVRHHGPEVLTATVSSRALDAYHRVIQRTLTASFSQEQVESMRVYGNGGYKLPSKGVSLTMLSEFGSLTGKESGIARSGLRTRVNKRLPNFIGIGSSIRIAGNEDMEDGIGEWEAERFLVNLAEAFGHRNELKQLLLQRRSKLPQAMRADK